MLVLTLLDGSNYRLLKRGAFYIKSPLFLWKTGRFLYIYSKKTTEMSLRIKYNSEKIEDFVLTLGENYSSIVSGETYAIYFIHQQNNEEFMTGFTDTSIHPEVYNRFEITTLIENGYDVNQIPFDKQGWYKYEVYTWSDRISKDNLLEMGKCYLYDNDYYAGNIPDNTETYVEEKTKYIYTR